MACYHPIMVPISRKGLAASWMQEVGCGHCLGCRKDQKRDWTIRIVHEASMHDDSWFVTLTYDDERIPGDRSVDPKHIRGFIKALRRDYPPKSLSYYAVGEYGEKTSRPHYHAVLFGADFLDRIYLGERDGNPVWKSPHLESHWPFGISEFSTLTPASAAYTAGYVQKKLRLRDHENAFSRCDPVTGEFWHVHPEFSRMSLRPAIGRRWIEKYYEGVYTWDRIVVNGQEYKPPRYYDKVMADPCKEPDNCFAGSCNIHQEMFLEIKEKRYEEMEDLSPYTLAAKERIHEVQLANRKLRSL